MVPPTQPFLRALRPVPRCWRPGTCRSCPAAAPARSTARTPRSWPPGTASSATGTRCRNHCSRPPLWRPTSTLRTRRRPSASRMPRPARLATRARTCGTTSTGSAAGGSAPRWSTRGTARRR
eukprot:jgi/Mesvir1/18159/Mv26542-RA.1